jgi:putative phage-type endonuclease
MIQLVAERLTGEPQEGYTNGAMEWGTDTEASARQYYEMAEGVQVQQIGFIERDEHIGASPDGLVGADGMVEIKCPNSTTHITYILEDRLPPAYRAQVQGELWVAERQWCDFVSYDPRMRTRKYFCTRVERDEKYIEELAAGISAFVEQMLSTVAQLSDTDF